MNNLQVLEHNNQRVLTTKQIAEAYEVEEVKVRQNFAYQKKVGHLVELKHFYSLENDELREFKNRVGIFDSVGIKSKKLILFTEKGAFMIAKTLNSKRAWDLYEELVDHYFNVREIVENNQPNLPSDPMEVLELFFQASKQTNKRVEVIEGRMDKIDEKIDEKIDNMLFTGEHWMKFKKAVKDKVHEISEEPTEQRKLYRAIYKAVQEHFDVIKCNQLKDKDYETVIKYVNEWKLDT